MEIFGIALIDVEDFVELVLRFSLNTLVILLLVRYLYYATSRRKDYMFTYFLISSSIFLLCFLLDNVKLELGFALGLFAVFGIIRYRTQQIEIKEMTYLFMVIGISVVNALANKKVSYAELLFTNFALLFITYLLERVFFIRHESRKVIEYERIDLIKPAKYNEMIADLEERTGLPINRVEVGKIDFLKDAARIVIYYFDPGNHINYADESGGQSGDDGDD